MLHVLVSLRGIFITVLVIRRVFMMRMPFFYILKCAIRIARVYRSAGRIGTGRNGYKN